MNNRPQRFMWIGNAVLDALLVTWNTFNAVRHASIGNAGEAIFSAILAGLMFCLFLFSCFMFVQTIRHGHEHDRWMSELDDQTRQWVTHLDDRQVFFPDISSGPTPGMEPWHELVAESFTCPVCGNTSYHPTDIAEKYCGHCHAFTGLARRVEED